MVRVRIFHCVTCIPFSSDICAYLDGSLLSLNASPFRTFEPCVLIVKLDKMRVFRSASTLLVVKRSHLITMSAL